MSYRDQPIIKSTVVTDDHTADPEIPVVITDHDITPITINLPATPFGYQLFWVRNIGGSSVNIDPNGNDIEGDPTNYVIAPEEAVMLVYEPVKGWILLSKSVNI